jgi:hypothetical protein
MIDRMRTVRGWIKDIFKDRKADDIQDANDGNEAIAFNRLYKVLLARWIVFRIFIEVARDRNSGKLPDTIKRDWLLFQILPHVLIDDKHPFVALMNTCLVGASTTNLQLMLDEIWPSAVLGSAFDHKRDTFFYILDEAQVAGEQTNGHMGAFSDANCKIPRPVLRPIVRAWTASTPPTVKIIVSGTGFSLDLFRTVLTSGIGKDPNAWDVVHTMGDFINRKRQESYVARYLPPSFLHSKSGAALLRRVFEWLRGR